MLRLKMKEKISLEDFAYIVEFFYDELYKKI